MHDVLSNWERRAVLYYLQERDDPVSVDRLAARLARWRDGTDASPRTEDESAARPVDDPAGTRTELLHSHVLKMADFGVVEYDSRADVVALVDDVTVSVRAPWKDRAEKPVLEA